MEFRYCPQDTPFELTLKEFRELVGAGKVLPTALYRDFFTEGRWDTVDNLRSFHLKSPVKYPPGPKLVERDKREAERIAEYERGPLIEDACRLRPLEEVGGKPGVMGAARLFILPSFEPERLVTVAFSSDGLRVEMVVAGVSVYQSLPEFGLGGAPDRAAQGPRRSASLEYRAAPVLFRSWEGFAERVASLGNCHTLCIDGTGFRHRLRRDGRTIDVNWSNPRPEEHPALTAVVEAYTGLLEAAGLPAFVTGLHS